MRSPDSRCQTGRYYQVSRDELELIKDKIGRQKQTFHLPPDTLSQRRISASAISQIVMFSQIIPHDITRRGSEASAPGKHRPGADRELDECLFALPPPASA
ncbi:hypothetical protein A9798_10450 [Edwardsiella hoshinae]|uniref:Uncharacterized protein n=1 Tax=Edwardsiella hoshinae TaxID=93378 RepID=A0ABM6EK60_9GAMM|nr:hypothetical protein A9798_10450 [Edwardsiella hoshinae]